MTIQVELQPELEDELTVEAEAQGVPLEVYAQRLFQSALAARALPRSRASQKEFRTFLDAMEHQTPTPPRLQSETFSREMIYGDHD